MQPRCLRLISGMSIDQASSLDTTADKFGFDDLDLDSRDVDDSHTNADTTADEGAGDDAVEEGATVDGDSSDQPGRKPDRHRHRAERTLIRRAVELSQALVAADADDRKLLGQAMGCPSDPGWLTAYVLTMPRAGITAPLQDLLALRELSVVDQVAEIAFMDRPRAAGLWGLLTALGGVQGRRPAVPMVAAKAAVAGLDGLSDADEARVRRVIDLVKGA